MVLTDKRENNSKATDVAIKVHDDLTTTIVKDEVELTLSFGDMMTISNFNADFAYAPARRNEDCLERIKTGVIINDDDINVTVQDAHFNGFRTMTIVQGRDEVVLTKRDVILLSGAFGGKYLRVNSNIGYY